MSKETEDRAFAESLAETIKTFQKFEYKKTVVCHFGDAEIVIAPPGFWDQYMEDRADSLEEKLRKESEK